MTFGRYSLWGFGVHGETMDLRVKLGIPSRAMDGIPVPLPERNDGAQRLMPGQGAEPEGVNADQKVLSKTPMRKDTTALGGGRNPHLPRCLALPGMDHR